jgi:hypothetical protein
LRPTMASFQLAVARTLDIDSLASHGTHRVHVQTT